MEASGGLRKTVKASFVLFGTIVGAGIFGLPYVVGESGYFIGLAWMALLAIVVTLTHLLYGEVVMATPGDHRMVGYVREYLGKGAAAVESFTSVIGLFGSCLAYLILGGLFMASLAEAFGVGVAPSFGASTLFLFGLASAWFGARFLSGIDFWLTLVEFGAFALLSAIALTGFDAANLGEVDLGAAFAPYGVVLFAYGGLAAVSGVRDIVGGEPRRVRQGIVAGTLMAAGLTALFVTAVLGALGKDVTPEAVGGLNAFFGGPLPVIGAVAGLFSILTSYVVFGEYLKSQFQKDFGFPRHLAVLSAVGVPFLLYLFGIRSFGRVLELVGAALIGLEGALVCLCYLAAKRRYPGKMLDVPQAVVWTLLLVYAAGAAYEIVFRTLLRHG